VFDELVQSDRVRVVAGQSILQVAEVLSDRDLGVDTRVDW
jgi:hypothetical protein